MLLDFGTWPGHFGTLCIYRTHTEKLCYSQVLYIPLSHIKRVQMFEKVDSSAKHKKNE